MADYLDEYAGPPITATPAPPPAAPDPAATVVPYAGDAPRAVSAAGPLPQPDAPLAPPNATTPDAPPELQQGGVFGPWSSNGILPMLTGESTDKALDDSMTLNAPSLKWSLIAFKGINPDVAARVNQLARGYGIPFSAANQGQEDLQLDQQARDIYASLSATDQNGNFVYPQHSEVAQQPDESCCG